MSDSSGTTVAVWPFKNPAKRLEEEPVRALEAKVSLLPGARVPSALMARAGKPVTGRAGLVEGQEVMNAEARV